VLWWAASVAAAAVAAADAVLARTLMLVLQPLDPWEAPRPRAPPLCWSPPGPLAAALPFPATRSPKPKQKEFPFLSGTIHLPLFLSLLARFLFWGVFSAFCLSLQTEVWVLCLFPYWAHKLWNAILCPKWPWEWWVVVIVRLHQALSLLGFSLFSWWDYYSSSIKLMVNLRPYFSSIKLMVNLGHYSSSIKLIINLPHYFSSIKLMVNLGHYSSSIKLMVTIIVHLSSFKVDFVSWWFFLSNIFLIHKIHG
jgi:hypothetical protein